MLYTKYYSSSDVMIQLVGRSGKSIVLDKASGILLNDSLSSGPVYTLGNSRIMFMSKGNLQVDGLIGLNFVHRSYLSACLEYINTEGSSFRYLSVDEQLKLDTDSLSRYKALEERQVLIDKEVANGSLQFSQYGEFEVNIIYNNGDAITSGETQIKKVVGCKMVGYESTADIGDDGQLKEGYRFIAREIL